MLQIYYENVMKININSKFLSDQDVEFLVGCGFGFSPSDNEFARELPSDPTSEEASSYYYLFERLTKMGYELKIGM